MQAAETIEASNVRRRLLTVAVFLLAGAVVNVAVAWGMAATVNPFLGERETSRTDGSYSFHFKRARVALSNSDAGRAWLHVVATAGWPLICSSYEYSFFVGGVGPILEGGLDLGFEPWPGSSPGRSWQLKALPLRPIWPGFLFNTLFYAAILWPVIPGPLALRRLIRRRRGLCPKCAYPMGESAVCSECGKELPQRVRAAT